tara:strand:+ start:1303 stop:2079 length:777 start_codon:yes stop_codon:yes gene_type:complete
VKKASINLFGDNKMTIEQRLSKLDDQAEHYHSEVSKGIHAAVNSHEFIEVFSDWYVDSRDLFADYFNESDISYAEFISKDTTGNGFTQSSHFSRLYPLYKQLRNKIVNGKGKSAPETQVGYNNKGFIIHGHNDSIKLDVARFIEKEVGKEATILHEMPNKGKTVIEKFESHSVVDFAIALWTSDDLGKVKKGEELQERARQNVIFETGYFIGKLGRDKVIILYENGVEKPSDYDGVVYIPLSGNWKYELAKEINSIYQ